MKSKILLIEDDKKISRFLELELKLEGYEVDQADNGKEGVQKVKYNSYDIIIMDIMMPKLNGVEACKKIRELTNIPIIMLTAKSEVSDKVIALEVGADDYVTKPFSTEELIARVKAHLRREKKEKDYDVLEYKDIKINKTTWEVLIKDQKVELSKREFELLEYFLLNSKIVLTRDKILESVWGFDYIGNDNVLDIYIKYLRDKIDKPFNSKYIQTVRGIGYIFK